MIDRSSFGAPDKAPRVSVTAAGKRMSKTRVGLPLAVGENVVCTSYDSTFRGRRHRVRTAVVLGHVGHKNNGWPFGNNTRLPGKTAFRTSSTAAGTKILDSTGGCLSSISWPSHTFYGILRPR